MNHRLDVDGGPHNCRCPIVDRKGRAPRSAGTKDVESSIDEGRIRAERRVGEPISARKEASGWRRRSPLRPRASNLLWTQFSSASEASDNAFKSH